MEAHTAGRRWTYSEFARLPSEGGTRHEIVAGELVVTPAPSPRHQRIVRRLVVLLDEFVQTHDLGEVFPGPVDVLLAEGDYLEPDVLFVRRNRLPIVTDRGIEGPPDFVVEVASPSTSDRDRGAKVERYRLFGVPEYWIVDPDAHSIDVWYLAEGALQPMTRLGGEQGWAPNSDADPVLFVDLEELFAGT